jgi:hypothetical protein
MPHDPPQAALGQLSGSGVDDEVELSRVLWRHRFGIEVDLNSVPYKIDRQALDPKRLLKVS